MIKYIKTEISSKLVESLLRRYLGLNKLSDIFYTHELKGKENNVDYIKRILWMDFHIAIR